MNKAFTLTLAIAVSVIAYNNSPGQDQNAPSRFAGFDSFSQLGGRILFFEGKGKVNIDELLVQRRWESVFPELKLSEQQLYQLSLINRADSLEFRMLRRPIIEEQIRLDETGQMTPEKFVEIVGALTLT